MYTEETVLHCRLNYDDDIVKTATSHHTVQTLDVHARVIDHCTAALGPTGDTVFTLYSRLYNRLCDRLGELCK